MALYEYGVGGNEVKIDANASLRWSRKQGMGLSARYL